VQPNAACGHPCSQIPVQSLDGSAFGNGAVLGCDFTGTVEKLGDKVTTVKVGDRIAGLIWGGMVTKITSSAAITTNQVNNSFLFQVKSQDWEPTASTRSPTRRSASRFLNRSVPPMPPRFLWLWEQRGLHFIQSHA